METKTRYGIYSNDAHYGKVWLCDHVGDLVRAGFAWTRDPSIFHITGRLFTNKQVAALEIVRLHLLEFVDNAHVGVIDLEMM